MSGSSHTCWHRRSPRHSLFRHGSETLYGDCFISAPVPPPGSWGPWRMTLIFWKQSVQYWSVGMSCLWHGLIYCAQEGSLFPVVPELIALTFTTLSCHTPPASRGRTCTEKYMQWTHRHCSLKQRRKQRGRHIDHWISNDKMEARTETWRILPQKVKKKKKCRCIISLFVSGNSSTVQPSISSIQKLKGIQYPNNFR